jgi:hypothetical protein
MTPVARVERPSRDQHLQCQTFTAHFAKGRGIAEESPK